MTELLFRWVGKLAGKFGGYRGVERVLTQQVRRGSFLARPFVSPNVTGFTVCISYVGKSRRAV